MSGESYELQIQYPNNPDLELFVLGRYFAEIACSKDNQSVALILSGAPGMGKSNTGCNLAYSTAYEMAKILGGTWNDYFPLDREDNWLPNAAVVSQKDIITLLGQMKKHQVYLLDDVGVGMNSRRFASEENILINDIFELMRIENSVVIMTCMVKGFIYKVPRSIVPFYGEMIAKYHDLNVNILKLFENIATRDGKVINPYLSHGKFTYKKYISERAPPIIEKAYDHMRSIKTKEDRKAKVAKYLEKLGDAGKPKIPYHERKLQEAYEEHGGAILKLHGQGCGPYVIAKEVPISVTSIRKIIAKWGGPGARASGCTQ